MPSNDFTNLSERPVDRRTLIKAGAWAAPAVVLIAATPAATASPFTLSVANFRSIAGNGSNHTFRIDVTNKSLTTNANVSVVYTIYRGTVATGGPTASGNVTSNSTASLSVGVSLPSGQGTPTTVSVTVTATGFQGIPSQTFTYVLGAN